MYCRENDQGYFGSGVYSSPQASYAALYPTKLAAVDPNGRGEHVMVLCFVAVNKVYPITRGVDYQGASCKFNGRPMASTFDAHVVEVDPQLGYQARKANEHPKDLRQELVVKDASQMLPRYLVYFK